MLRIPDPPLALLLVGTDPPTKGGGVFDDVVFDPLDVFDCGGVGALFLGDPGLGDMDTVADPVAVWCAELQFDEDDYEASDFEIVLGAFCPIPDPADGEMVTIDDPALAL